MLNLKPSCEPTFNFSCRMLLEAAAHLIPGFAVMHHSPVR